MNNVLLDEKHRDVLMWYPAVSRFVQQHSCELLSAGFFLFVLLCFCFNKSYYTMKLLPLFNIAFIWCGIKSPYSWIKVIDICAGVASRIEKIWFIVACFQWRFWHWCHNNMIIPPFKRFIFWWVCNSLIWWWDSHQKIYSRNRLTLVPFQYNIID